MSTAQETRKLIYRFIAESEGDKVGGASLVSVFLSEYNSRSADHAEALLEGLEEILDADSGPRLAACAWLVGALAANGVRSPGIEVALRKRLMLMEAGSASSSESDMQILKALRGADLALHSAARREDGD